MSKRKRQRVSRAGPSASAREDLGPSRSGHESAPEVSVGPRPGGRVDLVLIGLLALIAVFHVLTMPGMVYPGDNFAPRAEVAHLLQTGEWGIDYSFRDQLGGFVEERGQYLYENDSRRKFFSKYGVGYSLLYLPPLLAEKVHAGRIELMSGARSQLLFLNLYQVLLTLIIAAYLYLIARLYTPRRWLAAVFVLAAFYGTFVWHYLRSPTLDIFQLFPFLGAVYHVVRFSRGRAAEPESRGTWLHLLAASLWMGLLFLIKISYGPVLAVFWIHAVLAGPPGRPLTDRVRRALGPDLRRFALCLGLPCLLAGVVFLSVNAYRCGSIFEDGYGQWVRDGEPMARLSWSAIPSSLRGMFLQPDNGYNVFIHYPLFLLGLAGLPWMARRHRFELALLASAGAVHWLIIAAFHIWTGAWCYAPRYLMPPLLIGSLPAVFVVEWLLRVRRRWVCWGALAIVAATLLGSFHLQWQVNSLHYFTYYYLSSLFSSFQLEPVDRYFRHTLHRGFIHRDLVGYVHGNGEFPPMEVLRERISPLHRNVLVQVDAQLRQLAKPNVYFD